MNVSDFLVQRLVAWGVRRIFGYPGDGINGIIGALQRADNAPDFILVRHEEMAAFAACGQAKFTGQLGVCLATSGPGAIHLLNGLYDAKMDHQPVLAIVGQSATSSIGGAYQQEVDLSSLFKDVAHEYLTMVTNPAQLPEVVDRAVRIALSERTVTCLIFPADVQLLEAVEETPRKHGFVPGGLGFDAPLIVPDMVSIQRAADVLNEGERVAILVGSGARGADAEVVQVAELLGAGIAKALLGRDVINDELPFVTGSIGLLGTKPSWEMMQKADTLLMIGSSFPYSEFLPPFGQARGVQIDIDARLIGIRYPMEVNLVGESGATLRALVPHLKRKADRSWRELIERDVRSWQEQIADFALEEANPINPALVYVELNKRLPADVILTADSGTTANWYSRYLQLRPGMRASLSGNLATMGPGVPYAVGAKFAHPDRPVIALVGDGAMQMNGINELITISQYWKQWKDPRLIVLVLHNNDLNMVTWEQRAMAGDPRFGPSQTIIDFPYAAYAELLHLGGIRVHKPEQIGDAWDEALSADRPVVLDVLTDLEVPILPPHITLEEARNFMFAIAKGDEGGFNLLKRGIKATAKEFLK